MADTKLEDSSYFRAQVRAVALAGLSLASSADITTADTILSALGKLQAQIDGLGGGGGTTILSAYQAADFTKTSNNTLSNTSLSVTVAAGGIYEVRMQMPVDYGAGWMQCDFNGGTATMTHMSLTGMAFPAAGSAATPNVSAPITALGTSTAFGTNVEQKTILFSGLITVNAGGTFIFRAAQFSSDADPTVIQHGASMVLTKLN